MLHVVGVYYVSQKKGGKEGCSGKHGGELAEPRALAVTDHDSGPCLCSSVPPCPCL